jgi:hypothetical protein
MMKNYIVNGSMRRYPEGKAPEGAVPAFKAVKPVKKEELTEDKPVEQKAIKKPANKAKKAGGNK